MKNIKISNPTDPNFVQYQDLVDSYMSDYHGEKKPSQYVFSVISDSRIYTDFIWTVDQDTGEKVSAYFNKWNSGITGYHQFSDADFDDNHNDYRYSKRGVTLSYDKPKGSSGSISVVDDNHNILDLGDANLQDVYEINGSTDNSRSDSFAVTLPEKGQPIIKFLYRNPDTGKLMDLRAPIYYSNGLTGQKFELDIGDSYKQELKDMFAGFKLVGSSKASGTFTQFAQGKTYVEHIASDDSEVIYQQIDAEGTMKVFYREKDGEKQPLLDKHGNPYQLEAGSSVNIDTGNGIITAYNPFVTGDHAYELIYEPEDQSANIVYVDKDGNKIKTDTVNGKTTQTVDVKSNVPAGWKIIDGQVPEMIHFTGEGTPDTTITIEHDTTSVDHTKPIKPGDKTPSGKEIKGAHESDLNQTITRTINVTTPDGQTTTTKQVAKIYRDATIDDVTGEVTYGDWSEGTWVDFKPGQVAGYTASPADVPAVTVKDGQKDQTVNISYTANEGTVLIKYVDRDGNEIGQQVITGHVGDTIKVTPQFPENWVPVDPDTVPAEVQIKEENGQIIIVVVRHAEKDPVQTKKVTRTIKVTTPDGQTKTIKQVVTISRHGDLDLVTGQIAWQPWTTAQWDVFKPAAIAGYTPSLAEVPAVTVDGETTDQTVDITYAAVATPAQPEHQAPTVSDTTDAQQATNQKADSNAQPAVTVVTSQQTATAQQAESTTNNRRLPQTGNSHDASALAGLGLASLMGLFGLGGKRRKRD
ncbi:LPXTG cell wall anchor domain-containing protein [Lactobacillus crispatus]|nr:LPXTG cell wall anchor domain-containing protein [Lactobacillus crispatus]